MERKKRGGRKGSKRGFLAVYIAIGAYTFRGTGARRPRRFEGQFSLGIWETLCAGIGVNDTERQQLLNGSEHFFIIFIPGEENSTTISPATSSSCNSCCGVISTPARSCGWYNQPGRRRRQAGIRLASFSAEGPRCVRLSYGAEQGRGRRWFLKAAGDELVE